jgi:hypothetical protein
MLKHALPGNNTHSSHPGGPSGRLQLLVQEQAARALVHPAGAGSIAAGTGHPRAHVWQVAHVLGQLAANNPAGKWGRLLVGGGQVSNSEHNIIRGAGLGDCLCFIFSKRKCSTRTVHL